SSSSSSRATTSSCARTATPPSPRRWRCGGSRAWSSDRPRPWRTSTYSGRRRSSRPCWCSSSCSCAARWRRRAATSPPSRPAEESDMTASRTSPPTLLAALVASLLAGATTTFESTWRAPDARPLQLAGKKVVGLFVNKDLASRRSAEDALAREISAHGAQGVPAYAVLGDDEIKDKETVRAKLEQLGFAGAVVMRIAGRETQGQYQPPAAWASPTYGRFYGGPPGAGRGP